MRYCLTDVFLQGQNDIAFYISTLQMQIVHSKKRDERREEREKKREEKREMKIKG